MNLPKCFAEPVRDFLNYCRIECGFAATTIEAYGTDLRELSEWMHQRRRRSWTDLSIERIAAHLRDLDERGLSTRSICRHVATIRVFCRFLYSQGLVARNTAERLTQPVAWQTLPGVLGPKQVQKLLAAPDPKDELCLRDVCMLELLYGSGLRASEAATLTVERVHLDLAVVRVLGKGAKERIVPAGRPALESVRRYCEQLRPKLLHSERTTDRLLLSNHGLPITRVVVWQIVARQARRAGLRNVHPHTLRHSFATHMLAGGADLRVVQELLGHSNIRTTQVYTHVDASRLREVVSKCHPRP